MSTTTVNSLTCVVYVCFFTVVVALPFTWRTGTIKQRLLLFVAPMLIAIGFVSFIQVQLRRQTLRFLATLPPSCTVFINGQAVSAQEPVLTALRALKSAEPHHSHLAHPFTVDVAASDEKLHLQLSRDSYNPREYWVFYPEHQLTSLNEVGRIFTPAFDAY